MTFPGPVTRQGSGHPAVPLLPTAQRCPLPVQAGSQPQALPGTSLGRPRVSREGIKTLISLMPQGISAKEI